MSRRKFAIWIAPEIQQIDVCVNRLLTKAGVMPKDIDAISGPAVHRLCRQFENSSQKTFSPDVPIRAGQEFTSVAQGLAIHAMELLDS